MGAGTVISSIVAMVLSLALVLGLAWGVLWLLRRWQDRAVDRGGADEGESTLRFVRALPLGPRERVVLVEVRGETVMLGVTAGAITTLARWDAGGGRLPGGGDGSAGVPPARPAVSPGSRAEWR